MQGQYQEDKMGALDATWQLAKGYYLPWERASYDPRMFSVSRGAFNLGALNPFRRGSLINNPLTRGGTSLAGKGIKQFGWGKAVLESKSMKDFAGGFSSMINSADGARFGGMMYKDGYLGMSDTPFNQTKMHQNMLGRENKLREKISERGVQQKNRMKGRLKRLETKLEDTTLAQARVFRANRGAGGISNLPEAQALGAKMKNYRSLIEKANISIDKYDATTKGLKWKAFGTRLTKYGQQGAYGLGKITMRGAMLAGKMNAYAATASLAYSAINAVANPIAQASVNAIDQTFASLQSMANPEIGGRLELGFLSQGAATERQRAVQAISKSRINGRSMMGNEAQYMHA